MLTRLHNDECAGQFGFAVGPEHPAQFLVRGGQSGWTSAQQDDAFSEMLHEYQAAEILVTRNEDPAFLAGATQQGRVRSPGQANFGSGDHIVAAGRARNECSARKRPDLPGISRDGADVKVFALDNVNGVLHARLDVLGLEIGIVVADNRLGRARRPGPAPERPGREFACLRRRAFQNEFQGSPGFCSCVKHTPADGSTASGQGVPKSSP